MASVWKQMIQSITLLAQKDEDKRGKKIHDPVNVIVYWKWINGYSCSPL